MVAQHYRWDFIGLSSQEKPTPATSEKVVDGSTFYEGDTSKLYVFCKNQWYEKTATGGGGGVTVVQTTGTSTTDVMSQNAVTEALASAGGGGGDKVYSDKSTSNSSNGGAVYIGNLNSSQEEQADPTVTDNHYKYFWALPNSNSQVPSEGSINILGEHPGIDGIAFGTGAYNSDNDYYNISIGFGATAHATNAHDCIAVGSSASVGADKGVAIGRNAKINGTTSKNSVALGTYAEATRKGEVNVGTGGANLGYNSTDYRVIGGVHDGQLANDAVTVGQINALIDAINTATSSNISHIGS